MRREATSVLTVVVAVLVAGFGLPAAVAAFLDQGQASSAFTAAPDWVAPQAGGTTVAKATGYLGGKVKQGGTYYVYANVTDTGNPASGVSAVTSDVSQITSGATSVTLVAGSYTVTGVSYGYRSASLTANASLSAGAKTYSITSTDAATNSRTETTFSVTVDNTAPTASDIQTTNKTGGSSGLAEAGDSIVFTFSEQIDPHSIVSGWTGTSTNVTVRLIDGGCVLAIGLICSSDLVRIYDSANSSQLPFGTITLPNGAYNGVLLGTATTVVFSSSAMVQSGSVVTITLGSVTQGNSETGGSGQSSWDSTTTPYDAAGNAATGNVANESGGGDREF